MTILLIGSGGREHALAKKLAESSSLTKLFCAPGNPGIFSIAEKANINVENHQSVVDFCHANKIDLVVIGPEAPLADGLSDSLRSAGFPVFGPSKSAAQLESSKGFAKDFMQRHGIPTAKFCRFSGLERTEASQYISNSSLPVVLKADGLAAGKGVIIAENYESAIVALDDILGGKFGSAGNEVVIEEFLQGQEASVFALCDGENFITLAPAQDHKRAFDNDEGPNTGGMGAYSPAPIVSDEVLEKIKSQIILPTLLGMKSEGNSFVGCLFVGLMIHNGEPFVVEFNARFGDPETEAVLSILNADFAKLLFSVAIGKLDKSSVESVCNGFACCVILASGGYPDAYEKGKIITGIEAAEQTGAIIFHAGTAQKDGNLVTSGGRVLAVCGKGETLQEAIEESYRAVEKLDFSGKMYRKDIGKKGILA